jgi:hypothetical protein
MKFATAKGRYISWAHKSLHPLWELALLRRLNRRAGLARPLSRLTIAGKDGKKMRPRG